MPNGKQYTAAEDQALISNAALPKEERLTAKELASKLGRPLNSIQNRGRYLGLDMKAARTFEYWKGPEDQALIELANEGVSTKEIAARLERPLASVANRRVKWVKAGKITQ